MAIKFSSQCCNLAQKVLICVQEVSKSVCLFLGAGGGRGERVDDMDYVSSWIGTKETISHEVC